VKEKKGREVGRLGYLGKRERRGWFEFKLFMNFKTTPNQSKIMQPK
jgi:hypothetical protein